MYFKMVNMNSDLNNELNSLKQELQKIEDFCLSNQQKNSRLANLLKNLFDKASEGSSRSFGPLATLLVDDMDEETIWEELQTRNNPVIKYIEKKIKKIKKSLSEYDKLNLNSQEEDSNYNDDNEEQDLVENSLGEEDSNDEGEYDDDDDHDDDDDDENLLDEDLDQSHDDYHEDDESDEEYNEDQDLPKYQPSGGFDSDDELKMEAWLDAMDELDEQHLKKLETREKRVKANTVDQNDWDEDNDEDDIDFVQKTLYASDEEDDEEDEDIDPKKIRFNDFFVQDEPKKKSKARSFTKKIVDEDEEEDGDFDQEDIDDYEDEDEENTPSNNVNGDKFTTRYQKRMIELKDTIKQLEEELMAEKSWELKGEVKGAVRPENSLLDLPVDIERATKVAPIVTQEYTSSLEDLIKKRVKDEQFNDPSPNRSYAETLAANPDEIKDEAELSQEKSKLGLGDIYAEDYAKKFLNSSEEVELKVQESREEVLHLFNMVSRQLDSLTNFYFTPRPVVPEVSAKVLANQRALPAVEMEDITPFSVNSAATIGAPEQLMEKKRGKKITMLTSAELTREDRRKLRKHKKEENKLKKKEQDKDTSIQNLRRKADEKLNSELKSDKRVIMTSSNGKSTPSSFTKSSNFFSKLQEDATKNIEKTIKTSNKRKLEDSVGNPSLASKFKL